MEGGVKNNNREKMEEIWNRLSKQRKTGMKYLLSTPSDYVYQYYLNRRVSCLSMITLHFTSVLEQLKLVLKNSKHLFNVQLFYRYLKRRSRV